MLGKAYRLLGPMREECPECGGRGYVLPNLHSADRTDDPPSTIWCHNCDRKGYVPNREAQAILDMLSEYSPDLAREWRDMMSWPTTADGSN